ncbi:MAG: PP2C family protein-serine/threonine phosphatase [Planctomycetota bacterium]
MASTLVYSDLLDDLAEALVSVQLRVVDAAGAEVWRGPERTVPADGRELCVDLPGGERALAQLPHDLHPSTEAMLRSSLSTVARCEQLEQDMQSMNNSSVQLLEQVSMLGETLPRLSVADSVAELARTVLLACSQATGAMRAIFVQLHGNVGIGEVVGHVEIGPHGQPVATSYPRAERMPADEGLFGQVLATVDRPVWYSVGDRGFATDADAPESLARGEVVAVPVACDTGDHREVLGAILLYDKLDCDYEHNERGFGSEECQIALSFASMLGAILGVRQSAEFAKELSMAQAIQAQILPAAPARVKGFDVAGDYRNWGDVGGDYFDYVPLRDGRTLAVVADVSGHNLASGMMMVSARATLRTLAQTHEDPGLLFSDLARGMYQDLSKVERFLTAVGVALRPGTNELEIVNAGHNPPLLYRAKDRSVTGIEAETTVLGFLPEADFPTTRIAMEPGDCLLLYTDGVTEAANEDDEMFGDERLCSVLVNSASRSAADIIAMVMAAVHNFRRPGERGDDITLIAIKMPNQTKGTAGAR